MGLFDYAKAIENAYVLSEQAKDLNALASITEAITAVREGGNADAR